MPKRVESPPANNKFGIASLILWVTIVMIIGGVLILDILRIKIMEPTFGALFVALLFITLLPVGMVLSIFQIKRDKRVRWWVALGLILNSLLLILGVLWVLTNIIT